MTAMIHDNLNIGTCSWKYDSWKGIIYSDSVGKNYLSEYATHFRTVEIDQWFWSLFPGNKVVLPKPETVAEYVAAVPANFKFSVKVPNAITLTHHYTKGKKGPLQINPYFLSTDLFEDFLDLIDPMKDFLGGLIFQFEYLNKQKMKNQMDFQKRLSEFFNNCPTDYPYFLEIRNPNWINHNYFDFIQMSAVSHVFLHGYYMPSIFPLYEQFKTSIMDSAMIRLHGPGRTEIEKKSKKKWNQILEPKESELDLLVLMIDDMIQKDVQVILNVNNHYEGSAPLTIARFKERYTSSSLKGLR